MVCVWLQERNYHKNGQLADFYQTFYQTGKDLALVLSVHINKHTNAILFEYVLCLNFSLLVAFVCLDYLNTFLKCLKWQFQLLRPFTQINGSLNKLVQVDYLTNLEHKMRNNAPGVMRLWRNNQCQSWVIYGRSLQGRCFVTFQGKPGTLRFPAEEFSLV